MANNALTDYSTVPANNLDIAGISIAEGWQAQSANDVLRNLLAQIATFITGAVMKVYAAFGSTIKDSAGTEYAIGYLRLPKLVVGSARALALTDVAKLLYSSAGITVPPASSVTFTDGDTFYFVNSTSGALPITQGAGVTLRYAGTTNTGNRTVAAYGECAIKQLDTNIFSIGGLGLS